MSLGLFCMRGAGAVATSCYHIMVRAIWQWDELEVLATFRESFSKVFSCGGRFQLQF